ncbi:MAG: nicotinate-nucleotide adenylyltransferase [Gemmatimonadota bacterium]
MSAAGRIGVLGGTFDPPHVGHLIVAQDVHERLALDRLIVVPAARPPHRDPAFGAEQRFELVRSAFGEDPRFEVSDVELHRDGPSWTVWTLEEIQAGIPAAELFLVVGVDQYRTFAEWREPERILRLARLAVMPRDGEIPEPDPRFPFEPVPVTRVDVSSTQIRERLAAGRTVRYLVPESIRERLESSWVERTATSDPAAETRVAGRGKREPGDRC